MESLKFKGVKMRCPECLNYMSAKTNDSGSISGTCPVCGASIFQKQKNKREKLIRVVKKAN